MLYQQTVNTLDQHSSLLLEQAADVELEAAGEVHPLVIYCYFFDMKFSV